MHNTWAHLRVERGKMIAMMEECVHQRTGIIVVCRMSHHAGRFIHNEQRCIFIDDVERNIFRLRIHARWTRECNINEVMGIEQVTRFDNLAVHQHHTGFDALLNFIASGIFYSMCKIDIETFAVFTRGYDDVELLALLCIFTRGFLMFHNSRCYDGFGEEFCTSSFGSFTLTVDEIWSPEICPA